MKRYKSSFAFTISVLTLICAFHNGSYAQDLNANNLKKSFKESTIKVSISDNYEDIPPHKIYRSIFIKALLNPDFGVKFGEEDREIIYSLPSHNDVQFTEYARNSLWDACSAIKKVKGNNRQSAVEIGAEFENAKSKITKQLDSHYENVLKSLSESGREIIYAEILEKIETGIVTYSDINFTSLGGLEPEFTIKFIGESCKNVETSPGLNHKNTVYLRNELSDAYAAGSVQEFSPEENK